MKPVLYYVHDPMCSWCWGFQPVLHQLLAALPAPLPVQRVLGGLAPDSDQPMPADMRAYLEDTWRRIERAIPGTEFNFDFWTSCEPRRSTYPACRAVIAARLQGEAFDVDMTRAIQEAYYTAARNPSDDSTLISLAGEIGLDAAQFSRELNAEATGRQLLAEIEWARQRGVESFPGLLLDTGDSEWHIPVDYRDSGLMLELINELMP